MLQLVLLVVLLSSYLQAGEKKVVEYTVTEYKDTVTIVFWDKLLDDSNPISYGWNRLVLLNEIRNKLDPVPLNMPINQKSSPNLRQNELETTISFAARGNEKINKSCIKKVVELIEEHFKIKVQPKSPTLSTTSPVLARGDLSPRHFLKQNNGKWCPL